VVASAFFMTHRAIALTSTLAVAGVAATWLITRYRPTYY
jgi:hypothetical protein